MVRRLRGLILPALFALAAFALLISLGNWQVRRLAWKENLIADATERPKGPVLDLPTASAWPALNIPDGEYRPFRLTGRFLNDKEALVFTSIPDPRGPYGGPGYWVVTPFVLTNGGTVLVNRGFVPQDKSRPEDRGETLPDAPTTVTGLMRPDETRGIFTPGDEPEKNIFFARNISALSVAKDLSLPVAPFTIDLVAAERPPGGLPESGETRMLFPNNHLQYAVTWYGLAAALLAVFSAFVWRRLSETVDKPA